MLEFSTSSFKFNIQIFEETNLGHKSDWGLIQRHLFYIFRCKPSPDLESTFNTLKTILMFQLLTKLWDLMLCLVLLTSLLLELKTPSSTAKTTMSIAANTTSNPLGLIPNSGGKIWYEFPPAKYKINAFVLNPSLIHDPNLVTLNVMVIITKLWIYFIQFRQWKNYPRCAPRILFIDHKINY